jgi:hypothetical protein
MRFDPQSGALVIRPGLTITADTTAAELSRQGAEHEEYSNGWSWERLEEPTSGSRWSIEVSFDPEGHVSMAILTMMRADEPKGWASWSEAGEHGRRDEHTRWLEEQLGTAWRKAAVKRWADGEERSLPWGIVSSMYDSRSAGSSIVVRYQ